MKLAVLLSLAMATAALVMAVIAVTDDPAPQTARTGPASEPIGLSEADLLCNEAAADLSRMLERVGTKIEDEYGGIVGYPPPNHFLVQMVEECMRNGNLN